MNKKVLGSELYANYCYEKQHNKTSVSAKLKILRIAKSKLIEQAKRRARIKRAALKLMKMPKIQKKFLYQQISKSLINDIAQIRKNYSKEHQSLIYARQNKTWVDWLRQKAERGDQEALAALRYRNRKNSSNYSFSGVASNFFSAEQVDSITKEGTEIYKLDKAVIRNTGNEIKISKGGTTATLKKALEMAKQQYGNCIRVNGTPLFKKVILQIVFQNNMQITFADPDMEDQRKKLILNLETPFEQSTYGLNFGRRPTRSIEIVREGRNPKRNITGTKPNSFSIRQGPPAESQNSLRDLSELYVVQLTRRSKVLLPNNAPDKLECQRGQSDNNVRRSIFNLGLLTRR